MIKIMGFNGSPSPEGCTTKVNLRKALAAAEKAGAEVEYVDLPAIVTELFRGSDMPVWQMAAGEFALDLIPTGNLSKIAREKATDSVFPEPVLTIIRKMEEADGFIFATPTWWSMPSGYISTLLHYMTVCDLRGSNRRYSLRGKVAGFMSVCDEDGAQHANQLMQNTVTHMGMVTPPFCSHFVNTSSGGGEDNWQEKDVPLVGVNVVRMCRLLRGEVTGISWDWNSVDQPNFH